MTELEAPPREHDAGVPVERTFLIADVRGYTRFTRERGDAEAARLARTFAELARDAVEARGGHVIELRGDEALAVFSGAAQAVKAAVELVALCAEEVAVRPDLPLLVGIGIDLGEAVPVEGGFRGAALNTAARLCSQAAGGQVLVTSAVAEQAVDLPWIRFEPHGSVELKGFEQPVDLIAAVSESAVDASAFVSAAVEPLPLELDVETPIVGRERELSWLRGTWRQARRGHGRLVFVSGPPGIGKTRLAAELAAVAISQGASVGYAGAGGTGVAVAVSALRAAGVEPHPRLLVLDDFEALGETVVSTLDEQLESIEATRTMVVALVRDPASALAMTALLARADEDGDGQRKLTPFDGDGVRAIAAFYAPEHVDEMPLESIARRSGGVPARVHEELSAWAEQEATRRLAAAAEWLAENRRHREADLEFANTFIGLKLARLYERDESADDGRTAVCPYKGLSSFEESDARLFFGREGLVGELAARTVGSGLLAVVGASGSGKSSVIAAGLVPSLRAGLLPGSERWQATTIRPGEHPSAELDVGLADRPAHERLVLVVDQFEEVFTSCADEYERSAFVERIVSLADEAERSVVVVAVRADFYGRCGDYPELARLLSANQILVGPMTRDELRRAVELPARRSGVRVESALTDVLVTEIGEEAGGLPLLSTGLVELWHAQSDGWLRLEAHDRLGGVRAAVARLADSSYEHLADDQRDACRRLFLRLVTTGDEGVLTRRRAHLSELDLDRDETLSYVVTRLTDDRLLTAHEDSVEVAHEALLREWPRFQEWLRDDAQGRELREHLTQSARRWEVQKRSASDLYRGARLQSTLDWAAGREPELNDLEREFLAESRAENERELARQRRQNRRLKGLLAGVGVLLLAAIAAGAFALVQRSDAQDKARVALARQLGAQAVSEPRIDRAMLLAGESLNLDRSPATEGTLLSTLLRSPAATATFPYPITARPMRLAVSPDGRTLAVRDNNDALRFFDTRTRREQRPPLEHASSRDQPPIFSQDGSLLLVGGETKQHVPAWVLLDARTMQRRRTLPLDNVWLNVPTGFEGVALSPDGTTLIFGYDVLKEDRSDGPAYLDRWVGTRLTRVPLGSTGMIDVAFIRDGTQIVTVTLDEIATWDARTLRKLHSVRQPVRAPFMLGSISPDGRTVAFGTSTGSLFFVDTTTGTERQAPSGHSADVDSVTWSPDGRVLASSSDDKRVILWDPSTLEPLETLQGHGGRVLGTAFGSRGDTLYSASLDGAVFEWDLGGDRRFGRPFRIEGTFRETETLTPGKPPLAVAGDGSAFAVRSGNSRVRVFSTKTLRPTQSFPVDANGTVTTVDWSPVAPLLAVGGYDGPVQLWDVKKSPRLLRSLRGLRSANKEPEAVQAVAFSPSGDLVAAVDLNRTPPGPLPPIGSLAVWRTGTGRLSLKPRRLPAVPVSVAFDGNGKQLAIGLDDSRALIVDAATGKIVRTLPATGGAVTAVEFAPDGTLATGSWAGIVERWDVETGRRVGHPVLAAAAPVASIDFDPTGSIFATTGGADGILKLWRTSTLQQYGTDFPAAAGTWGNAFFVPSVGGILSVFSNGRGFAWPATSRAWSEHACRVAGRNFTREEWSRFVGDRSYARVCTQFASGR